MMSSNALNNYQYPEATNGATDGAFSHGILDTPTGNFDQHSELHFTFIELLQTFYYIEWQDEDFDYSADIIPFCVLGIIGI
jgi:hypothetical protein